MYLIFSPASVQMPGKQCCNGGCRGSYADYGTYLKNRKCVTPSDLCTLEHKVQHGHISYGCISQSGGVVLIDCNLDVEARNFITLNSGGSIDEKANTYVEIQAGGGSSCTGVPIVPTDGTIRLDASKNIEAYAGSGGAVEIKAGCPCSPQFEDTTIGTVGPGDVIIGAESNLEAYGEDNVFLMAGCSFCTPPASNQLSSSSTSHKAVLASAHSSFVQAEEGGLFLTAGCDICSPANEDMTKGIFMAAENDVIISSKQKDVIVKAGCGNCDIPTTFVGPKNLQLLGQSGIYMGSNEDISIHAGCCTGDSGKVDICGPESIYIHSDNGTVSLSGTTGNFITTGPLHLESTSSTVDISAGTTLTMQGDTIDMSGTTIDISGTTIDVSGTNINIEGNGSVELKSDTASLWLFSNQSGVSPDLATLNGLSGITNQTAQNIVLDSKVCCGIHADKSIGILAEENLTLKAGNIFTFDFSTLSLLASKAGDAEAIKIGATGTASGVQMFAESGPVAIFAGDTPSQTNYDENSEKMFIMGNSGISMWSDAGPVDIDAGADKLTLHGTTGLSMWSDAGPVNIDAGADKLTLHGSTGISMWTDTGPVDIDASADKLTLHGSTGLSMWSDSGNITIDAGPSSTGFVDIQSLPQLSSQQDIVINSGAPSNTTYMTILGPTYSGTAATALQPGINYGQLKAISYHGAGNSTNAKTVHINNAGWVDSGPGTLEIKRGETAVLQYLNVGGQSISDGKWFVQGTPTTGP